MMLQPTEEEKKLFDELEKAKTREEVDDYAAVGHLVVLEQNALHRVFVCKTLCTCELIEAVVWAWGVDVVLKLDSLTLMSADKG